ncbi:transporter [Sphingomonas sp. KR3-1]|uniref:transporter n=1 Tax=Sphingomonas sp. KR3-1 TaxID=3156611 RepID=UPI0032B52F4E
MKRSLLLAAAAFGGIASAQAQDLRPLCADRPGLDTPACTVDPGHLVVEAGLADWSLDRDSTQRTDSWTFGDLLLRYGVTPHTEVQLGWTALGAVRTHDRLAGAIDHSTGTGDTSIALRRNLSHPDGSGFAAAVMPYATLPTGGKTLGAGDWGGGLIVPLSYSLSDSIGVSLTPEIDAAVDGDRHGRHLAYGSAVGVSATLAKSVTGTLEFQGIRDQDPAGHATQALASVSLAWQPRGNLQLDTGMVAGLNAASPDLELYLGIARRF